MQCCGAIYHLVDPKIDKNRQNPQDTCSKIPGRVFSEGAEAPEAGHHQSHSSGELPPRWELPPRGGITTSGDLETGKKSQLLVVVFGMFRKMLTFPTLKIEML